MPLTIDFNGVYTSMRTRAQRVNNPIMRDNITRRILAYQATHPKFATAVRAALRPPRPAPLQIVPFKFSQPFKPGLMSTANTAPAALRRQAAARFFPNLAMHMPLTTDVNGVYSSMPTRAQGLNTRIMRDTISRPILDYHAIHPKYARAVRAALRTNGAFNAASPTVVPTSLSLGSTSPTNTSAWLKSASRRRRRAGSRVVQPATRPEYLLIISRVHDKITTFTIRMMAPIVFRSTILASMSLDHSSRLRRRSIFPNATLSFDPVQLRFSRAYRKSLRVHLFSRAPYSSGANPNSPHVPQPTNPPQSFAQPFSPPTANVAGTLTFNNSPNATVPCYAMAPIFAQSVSSIDHNKSMTRLSAKRSAFPPLVSAQRQKQNITANKDVRAAGFFARAALYTVNQHSVEEPKHEIMAIFGSLIPMPPVLAHFPPFDTAPSPSTDSMLTPAAPATKGFRPTPIDTAKFATSRGAQRSQARTLDAFILRTVLLRLPTLSPAISPFLDSYAAGKEVHTLLPLLSFSFAFFRLHSPAKQASRLSLSPFSASVSIPAPSLFAHLFRHPIDMTSGYFAASNSQVPLSVFLTAGTVPWLFLNDPSVRMPSNAYDLKDALSHDTAFHPDTGELTSLEWGRTIDWHRRDQPWRAFIPTTSPTPQAAWWLSYGTIAPVVPQVAGDRQPRPVPYAFSQGLRRQVANDFADVESAILLVAAQANMPVCKTTRVPVHTPARYAGALDASWLTKADAAQAWGTARRLMCDALGWLNWASALWDSSESSLQHHVVDKFTQTCERFGVGMTQYRGVLVDLTRDWRDINIEFLVRHDVPIVYPWTDSESSNPRFGRMSPQWLQALTRHLPPSSSDPMPPLSFHRPKVAKDLNDSGALHPLTFDRFFQVVVRSPQPGRPGSNNVPRSLTHWCIDFEEWGLRPLDTRTVQQAYRLRYFYRDFHDQSTHLRIYYRHRPVSNRSLPAPSADSDSGGDTDDDDGFPPSEAIDFVREFGRFRYAPQDTSRSHDLVTGDPVYRPILRSTVRGVVETPNPSTEPHPSGQRRPLLLAPTIPPFIPTVSDQDAILHPSTVPPPPVPISRHTKLQRAKELQNASHQQSVAPHFDMRKPSTSSAHPSPALPSRQPIEGPSAQKSSGSLPSVEFRRDQGPSFVPAKRPRASTSSSDSSAMPPPARKFRTVPGIDPPPREQPSPNSLSPVASYWRSPSSTGSSEVARLPAPSHGHSNGPPAPRTGLHSTPLTSRRPTRPSTPPQSVDGKTNSRRRDA
ncbi:hypothetical protein PLICRDRAFT_33190 [Plicaturopsis crispa FD-325 SS-3]|uniref:Uncharacterized protein n=1 Tax=Plicaturopsis crispa FD-325 SS-3 TaxID=944288 RepID=A0A0C9T131_PLICR|nr:hypothetical protein PLICRDRAFT_33190 [Plicaturopsis crispa FD-325 SS-3]